MSICPNCHNSITEDAVFCPVCGTSISSLHSFPEPYPPQQGTETHTVTVTQIKKEDPFDHTKIYYPGDVQANKVTCMLVYLLDFIGIIIGLLASPNSEFTKFHIKQSMKFCVVEACLAVASALLCWTMIVPVLAAVAFTVLYVVKIISFVDVCAGKAIEPYLIRHIKFLK